MHYSKNLLIGLGGTGQKVLLETKRSLMAANDGKVPKEIVFLAFDTDQAEPLVDQYTGEIVEFENDEFMRFNPGGSVAVAQEADWWPAGCNDWPNPGPGAAAKRMHGRAKMANQIKTVKHKIDRAIQRCRAESEAGRGGAPVNVRVTIACSLAGGTGAGCWLDIANIVHNKFATTETEDKLRGIFLLGDAFKGLPGTQHKNANTVACLRELQWLMEGDIGKDNPNKNYVLNGQDLKFPDGPIFNSCSLITKKTKSGIVIEDLLHIMKSMGRYLFHMCGKVENQFERVFTNLFECSYPYYGEGRA